MANEAHKEPTMEEILASIRKIISDDDTTLAPTEAAAETADVPAPAVVDDGFDELRFEPGEGELDDSVFEDVADDKGSDTLSEIDSFADSNYEASAAEVAADPVAAEPESWDVDPEVADLSEIEAAPEIVEIVETEMGGNAIEEVADEEEEDVSFEAMLGAVNKVAEDFDAVSGDIETEIETEVVETLVAQPEPIVETMEPEMPVTPMTNASRLTDDATAGAAAGSLGKLFSTMELGSENTIDGLVREMLKPMIKEWLDANLAAIVEQKVEAEVQRIASMAR